MDKQEARIQQEIVLDYNNTYCRNDNPKRSLIAHIANENQQHLISIGLLPGFSDLIVLHAPEHVQKTIVIFVEVKTDKGTQSPNQLKFEQRVKELGFTYILVRSVDDFKNQLNQIENTHLNAF